MDNDRESLGLGIGRLVSGCCILTVEHEGRSGALLVSWVQQAAFDPPSVTVCVKKGRPAQELIDGGQRFVLNVIGDDPGPMFKQFGKGFSLDENPFDGVTTSPTEYGPALEACIAQLGCRVTNKVDVGDHDLYVAEVLAASASADALPYVHIRKNGFSY